jgi:hypothetical protein
MYKNKKLNKARNVKNDEFYTPLNIIEEEIEAYYEYDKNVFKEKVVYLNCDNPYESNFFKYFVLNFNRFGLKQLIATNYGGDLVAGTLNPLFDNLNKINTAYKVIINEVINNTYNLDDLLNNSKNTINILQGDDVYPAGDFRSKECIELLQKSDIIVTNPPFSLFREFINLLITHNKKFIVLGFNASLTYKNIFRYFKENKLWVGVNKTEIKEYIIPTNTGYANIKMGNTLWFTNLKHSNLPKKMELKSMKENLEHSLKYPDLYKEYDNFYAIEVPSVKLIPNDYNGVLGVPFTILYKYNPEQFEILSPERFVDELGYSFLKKPGKQHNECKVNGRNVFRRIFIKLKK